MQTAKHDSSSVFFASVLPTPTASSGIKAVKCTEVSLTSASRITSALSRTCDSTQAGKVSSTCPILCLLHSSLLLLALECEPIRNDTVNDILSRRVGLENSFRRGRGNTCPSCFLVLRIHGVKLFPGLWRHELLGLESFNVNFRCDVIFEVVPVQNGPVFRQFPAICKAYTSICSTTSFCQHDVLR